MIRIGLLIIAFVLPIYIFAQVTTNPSFPIDSKAVTITFDATQGSAGLKDYTGDVYVHTGLITDKSNSSSDWKYTIGSWGNNSVQPKLTRLSANTYSFEITPDIRSFYKVSSGDVIKQLAFVFRNSDGTKTGKATGDKDIFATVYTEGLNLSITSPSKVNVFEKNTSIQFSGNSTATSDFILYLNDQQIDAQSGIAFYKNIIIPNAGNYWLKVKATQNSNVKRDSVYVCIRETTITESRPAGLNTGINYIDDQSATLIIWAPYKNNIFIVGDFNGWYPDNAYQMKKDGDYYWLTINNLVPQKEYIYQYLIDGNLQIADAYTDKVSDPDDRYISSSVYPNLTPYPSGKAVDRASVLQTAQTPFHWTTTTYAIPPESKLSVYELLIRDYTTEGTYKALQAKLDYLKRLGINTIELMPVTEFEGNISWGYNVNFYFAPDKAYGTKNDLKALIDECHKQGFIVIQDIVLNHSFGSSPMVKMYWNSALNQPAANNPWFNQTSPNPVYSWGYDFNHESQATKDFVDRVTSYWMTEYKVDGFRFDFTKGFTNTPGDGYAYDASRIAILERMASKIWTVNPKAEVILEHFTANTEEQELTAYSNGMMVWGNTSNNSLNTAAFSEAAMGYNGIGKSDFSWASYQQRGFSKPGLVAYMESHDEERQMYKTITYGNSSGTYNTKNLTTALKRSQLTTAFFMSLAGPKMIWQFGELGYDYSINTCQDGSLSSNCRTDPKPIRWDYLDDPNRQKLFDVYSAMLRLRAQYDVFTSGKETLSVGGVTKVIQLTLNDHNITLVGNFDEIDQQLTVNFQHSGNWNEFFSGASLNVLNTSTTLTLKPGEYRLYSDKLLPAFKDLATEISGIPGKPLSIQIYPNPVTDILHIETLNPLQNVEIFSVNGKIIYQSNPNSTCTEVNLNSIKPGIYLIRVLTKGQLLTEKMVKN